MADRVSKKNGRHELAYAGETPWHGFGTQVDGLQTVPSILEKAGLLWTVSTRPVYFGDPSNLIEIPDQRVVVRDDLNIPLGMVTKRYHTIQNAQAGEVVEAVVAEGQAICEVAGALDNGERCWILAQIPGNFEVIPGDEVKKYVLLAWGHDGKHGLAMTPTGIRVVCNNTLGQVLGETWSAAAKVFIKHNASAKVRIEEARTALGLVKKQTEQEAEALRALAATKVSDAEVAALFTKVFEAPVVAEEAKDEEYEAKLARWNAVQDRLVQLYQTGKGTEIPGVKGSAWGAVNAVSEYIDHVYPVTQAGKVSVDRQESAIFGSYANFKTKAVSEALALVK